MARQDALRRHRRDGRHRSFRPDRNGRWPYHIVSGVLRHGAGRAHDEALARRRAAMPSAVALSQVTVGFRLSDGGSYQPVEWTSLAVADGEFVAIVGPTGCGKSTLLNVAAGLIGPSHGTATCFGKGLTGLNRLSGYLFQAEALFPWKTALENVAIGLEIAGTPKPDARARAEKWLTRVRSEERRVGKEGRSRW